MDKMKIEIWSDIACPYCYIGKRKLENALVQFPNRDKIELVWHSYELNPTLPKKALSDSFVTYFAKNHEVSEDEAQKSLNKIDDLAKSVGLDYSFDKLVVANTSDALRLVKLASKIGKATEAEEILFEAYFVKGEDVSCRDNIIAWGLKLGISKAEITDMLDSDIYLNEINKDIDYSENKLDLEYIPFYLFNNNQIVQGSISSEDYLKILNESFADWEKNGVSSGGGDVVSGQSCSIDGHCS